MPSVQRIGVWFGQGLHNALAARAALGQLQVEHPGADWVLFGPRSSLFLFEMDERVPVYIPLRALEPRRPAQTRLSYYLEKRAQFKKLRGLKLNLCIGVSALADLPEQNQQADAQFQHVQKMLGVGGQFMQQELSGFLRAERPMLQAGPQALAYATQLYRKTSPSLIKAVALLHAEENAILYAVKNGSKIEGATLYTTLSPCIACARLILSSGIREVFYRDSYAAYKGLASDEGVDFLNRFGVKTTLLNGN